MAELDENNWIEISEETKERLSSALKGLIDSLERNKDFFNRSYQRKVISEYSTLIRYLDNNDSYGLKVENDKLYVRISPLATYGCLYMYLGRSSRHDNLNDNLFATFNNLLNTNKQWENRQEKGEIKSEGDVIELIDNLEKTAQELDRIKAIVDSKKDDEPEKPKPLSNPDAKDVEKNFPEEFLRTRLSAVCKYLEGLELFNEEKSTILALHQRVQNLNIPNFLNSTDALLTQSRGELVAIAKEISRIVQKGLDETTEPNLLETLAALSVALLISNHPEVTPEVIVLLNGGLKEFIEKYNISSIKREAASQDLPVEKELVEPDPDNTLAVAVYEIKKLRINLLQGVRLEDVDKKIKEMESAPTLDNIINVCDELGQLWFYGVPDDNIKSVLSAMYRINNRLFVHNFYLTPNIDDDTKISYLKDLIAAMQGKEYNSGKYVKSDLDKRFKAQTKKAIIHLFGPHKSERKKYMKEISWDNSDYILGKIIIKAFDHLRGINALSDEEKELLNELTDLFVKKESPWKEFVEKSIELINSKSLGAATNRFNLKDLIMSKMPKGKKNVPTEAPQESLKEQTKKALLALLANDTLKDDLKDFGDRVNSINTSDYSDIFYLMVEIADRIKENPVPDFINGFVEMVERESGIPDISFEAVINGAISELNNALGLTNNEPDQPKKQQKPKKEKKKKEESTVVVISNLKAALDNLKDHPALQNAMWIINTNDIKSDTDLNDVVDMIKEIADNIPQLYENSFYVPVKINDYANQVIALGNDLDSNRIDNIEFIKKSTKLLNKAAKVKMKGNTELTASSNKKKIFYQSAFALCRLLYEIAKLDRASDLKNSIKTSVDNLEDLCDKAIGDNREINDTDLDAIKKVIIDICTTAENVGIDTLPENIKNLFKAIKTEKDKENIASGTLAVNVTNAINNAFNKKATKKPSLLDHVPKSKKLSNWFADNKENHDLYLIRSKIVELAQAIGGVGKKGISDINTDYIDKGNWENFKQPEYNKNVKMDNIDKFLEDARKIFHFEKIDELLATTNKKGKNKYPELTGYFNQVKALLNNKNITYEEFKKPAKKIIFGVKHPFIKKHKTKLFAGGAALLFVFGIGKFIKNSNSTEPVRYGPGGPIDPNSSHSETFTQPEIEDPTINSAVESVTETQQPVTEPSSPQATETQQPVTEPSSPQATETQQPVTEPSGPQVTETQQPATGQTGNEVETQTPDNSQEPVVNVSEEDLSHIRLVLNDYNMDYSNEEILAIITGKNDQERTNIVTMQFIPYINAVNPTVPNDQKEIPFYKPVISDLFKDPNLSTDFYGKVNDIQNAINKIHEALKNNNPELLQDAINIAKTRIGTHYSGQDHVMDPNNPYADPKVTNSHRFTYMKGMHMLLLLVAYIDPNMPVTVQVKSEDGTVTYEDTTVGEMSVGNLNDYTSAAYGFDFGALANELSDGHSLN